MPKVNKAKKGKKKRKTYKEMMNEIINKAPETTNLEGSNKDVESIKQSVGGGTVSKVDKI